MTQENGQNTPGQGGRSGLGDLFGVSNESGAGFEAAKEMFYAPSEFSELIARSRVPTALVGEITRCYARWSRVATANTNIFNVIGLRLQLTIGADGEARREVKEMVTGIVQSRLPQFHVPPMIGNLRTNKTVDRGGPNP